MFDETRPGRSVKGAKGHAAFGLLYLFGRPVQFGGKADAYAVAEVRHVVLVVLALENADFQRLQRADAEALLPARPYGRRLHGKRRLANAGRGNNRPASPAPEPTVLEQAVGVFAVRAGRLERVKGSVGFGKASPIIGDNGGEVRFDVGRRQFRKRSPADVPVENVRAVLPEHVEVVPRFRVGKHFQRVEFRRLDRFLRGLCRFRRNHGRQHDQLAVVGGQVLFVAHG